LLSSYEWKAEIRAGKVASVSGEVSRRFLSDCADELKRAKVSVGEIRGVKRGGYVALEFSKSIPKSLHQRLSNMWSEYDRHR